MTPQPAARIVFDRWSGRSLGRKNGMSLEMMLFVGVMLLGIAVVLLLQRRRQVVADDEPANNKRGRAVEDIDTVAAWPPEVTRLLTAGERSAHEVLLKALPECMMFAQVPLARFIKVPRRHSYAEWLTRVGHLCADLVICDRSTLVIGVVLLTSTRSSERAERRRTRMTRVLKSAGVKVFLWREESLPSVELARDQITQRIGDIEEAGARRPEFAEPKTAGRPAPGSIPVPEVHTIPLEDGPLREPPPSTWFDDLDSGRIPLESEQRPRPLNPKPNPPDPFSSSGRR
jgi:hypothetical protein